VVPRSINGMEEQPVSNSTTLPDDIGEAQTCPVCQELGQEIAGLRKKNRALHQALAWCVVNDGETLGDHPKLLLRFQQMLGMELPDGQ
jgi:hypothetical protein